MKRLVVSYFIISFTFLITTGCTKNIKPEDLYVEAVYQFKMPDYESTIDNVKLKSLRWIRRNNLIFIKIKDNVIYVIGKFRMLTHKGFLTGIYSMQLKILTPNKVELYADNFMDKEEDLKGYSDILHILDNCFANKILDLGDGYLKYMETNEKTIE